MCISRLCAESGTAASVLVGVGASFYLAVWAFKNLGKNVISAGIIGCAFIFFAVAPPLSNHFAAMYGDEGVAGASSIISVIKIGASAVLGLIALREEE